MAREHVSTHSIAHNNRPSRVTTSDRRARSLLFCAAVESLENLTLLSTFTVTNTADSGAGSLRSAITSSNSASSQTNTIYFQLSGNGAGTISLLGPLPMITSPVVIDATTILGYTTKPLIQLDGTNAGAGSNGLIIGASAPGSTIKGLNFRSFGGDGIDVLASNSRVSGNFIGTSGGGSAASPNAGNGLVVFGANNTIGGVNQFNPTGKLSAFGGNLISGNSGDGVVLAGNGNVVTGNWIGLDVGGQIAISNAHDGVLIEGASSNTVGGTTPGTSNLISGNQGQGVSISNIPPVQTTTHSNSAGPLTLTAAGIAQGFSLTNFATNFSVVNSVFGPYGISFTNGGGVLTSAFDGKVYSFPSDADGQDASLAPTTNYNTYDTGGLVQFGGHIYMCQPVTGDIIEVSNKGAFIQKIVTLAHVADITVDMIPGPSYGHLFVTINGNDNSPSIWEVDPIAKKATLFTALPASGDGIVLDPNTNRVYVVCVGANSYGGIVGYDLTTRAKLFDSGQFSKAEGSPDGLTIGIGDLRDKIFVNTNQGTIVEVPIGTSSTRTIIASGGSRGDLAKVDPSNGTFLLTQTDRIVRLTAAPGSSFVGGPSAVTTGNVIEGNVIGLAADGKTPVGNSKNGVQISAGATGNTIGGTLSVQGNIIDQNAINGVTVIDAASLNNAILENTIGTDSAGTRVAGNAANGVLIGSGVSKTLVAYNTIANSGAAGVALYNAPSVGNTIQANSIFDNAALGIDLGQDGVTLNGWHTTTAGPNEWLSYPTLTEAYSSATETYIVGTASAAAGSILRIEFFSNPSQDASSYGQGRYFLGSATITAGSIFQVILPRGVPVGQWISATETTSNGDTSEFSTDIVDLAVPIPTVYVTPSSGIATYRQAVSFTATVQGTPTPTGTVEFLVDGKVLDTADPIDTTTGQVTSSSISTLGVGTHTVTAIYSGDGLHISLSASSNFTVNKAHLTVTAVNAIRRYGDPNPNLSASLSGFVNGENATVVTGAASLSTAATPTSRVGSYPVVVQVGTLSAANYDFPNMVNGSLSVIKAHLTVSANSASKLYGSPNPTFTLTISGFFNGDTSAVLSGAAKLTTVATASSGVGTYSITVQLGTLSATNYDFTTLVNSSLSVTPAHLTVTAQNQTKYPGDPNPILTYIISGFVGSDTNTVVSGAPSLGTTAVLNSPVGTYPITVAAGNLSAANYDFSTLVNGVLTVTTLQATTLSLTPANASPTYGQTESFTANIVVNPRPGTTPGGSVQFQVDGKNFGTAVPVSNSAITSTITKTLAAGSHIISATYSGDANFVTSTATINLNVAPTASQLAFTNPVPSGLVAWQTFTVAVTTEDTTGTVVPNYNGSVTISLRTNPTGSALNGTLTAPLVNGVATFSGISLTKAGTGFTLTAVASGLPEKDSASFNIAGLSISGEVLNDTQATGSLVTNGNDPGLANRIVYIDANNNGMLDGNEISTTTDPNGHFSLSGLSLGTDVIRVVTYPGDLTFGPAGNAVTVNLTSSNPNPTVNIGIQPTSLLAPFSPNANPFGTHNPDVETAEVNGIYQLVFNRAPDPSGLASAVKLLKSGWTPQQLASLFVSSAPEYYQKIVSSFYVNFLGRVGSAQDVSNGAKLLQGGYNTVDLAQFYLTCQEFNNNHADNTDFVKTIYHDVVGREATSSELTNTLNQVSIGTPRTTIVSAMIHGNESITRAVSGFYTEILARPGDATGIANNVALVLSGQANLISRSLGFFNFTEFMLDAKRYVG